MKIPVLGKSGPRLVTTGLTTGCVCASAPPSARPPSSRPPPAQRKILEKFPAYDPPCLRFILRQPITAYGFVVLFGSAETRPDLASAFAQGDKGYLPAGVMRMIVRPDLRRN